MEGLFAGQGIGLAYALMGGLLIGLERGWTARGQPAGSRVAGFRTFGLLGLTGGVAGLLGGWPGAAILAGGAAVAVAGYWRSTLSQGRLSATDAVAALLALGLGALATTGRPSLAIGAAAVVTMLLSMRQTLHRWLRGVAEEELHAAARFALIALVVLPLAPDAAMGPLAAWNPHKLWFVVVLVSGLSFLGYVTARRAAPSKSVLLTAACGAIVSSTAVTAASARRLRADPSSRALGLAIPLATLVMLFRVLILVAVLLPQALPSLALIMLPGLLILIAPMAAGIWHMRHSAGEESFAVSNPLELRVAFALAALTAVTMLAAKWAEMRFGHLGLAALVTITGFVDVDAAIITLGTMNLGAITPRMAGILLAGPMLANNLIKAVLTISLAPNRPGLRAGGVLAASALASGTTLALLA